MRPLRFLTLREQEIQNNHPQMMNVYIQHVQRVKQRNQQKVVRIWSFEHVQLYFEPQLSEIIRAILREGISPAEAGEFNARLQAFPALRSTVNANLFLMFVCITHGAIPSVDKIDDHRHIIEASYCNSIVIQDGQLRRNASRINPDLKVLSLADLS